MDNRRKDIKMEKPLSILIREAKSNLSNVINDAGLPPDILVPIVKDLYLQLVEIAEDKYKRDLAQYNESLKVPSVDEDTEVVDIAKKIKDPNE